MRDILEKFKTEEGIFNLLGVLALVFSAWLVVNFEASTVVFFGYGILLLAALAYRFMTESDYFESHKLFGENFWADVLWGVMFGAVWVAIIKLTPYGTLPLPPLPPEILAVSAVSWVVVVLLAPVTEELFFRGSLMPQLKEWFNGNIWLPILLSGALFAAFHWIVYLQGALSSQLFSAFLFGIFVGILVEIRKSTMPAIITHMIVNAVIISSALAVVL